MHSVLQHRVFTGLPRDCRVNVSLRHDLVQQVQVADSAERDGIPLQRSLSQGLHPVSGHQR